MKSPGASVFHPPPAGSDEEYIYMNKVTVHKQQNAESQDKGMGLLPMDWLALGKGSGLSLGPTPCLPPPSQHHRQAWCGYFGKSYFS